MADPKIKYDIAANVSGDADVEKLASEVERLGKTLEGDLKTSADAAAAALRELGAKNQAAQSFFDLKLRTQEAAKALTEAQAAAQAMGREIAQTGEPTRVQASQLEKLKDAVKAANTEYQASHTALGQARDALGQYGLSVKGLAQTQQVLKRELAQARTETTAFSGELRQHISAEQQAAIAARDQAAALSQANAATKAATSAAREADNATRGWAASIGKIAAGNVLANVLAAITGKVQETGRAFVEANIQLDGMRRALTAVYKDAGTAEAQIGFLRKTSNEAGVSFAALGDSFKSFAAATSAANIPISVTNELFGAVTKASATLGLSGERTSLVLQALGQMASKGTVSMEELRQQLGESLPGALSLAAKGLGLTEQQLIKLVESGQLAARDLFPALTQSLKTMQSENDGLQGSWERLKTAINGVMTAVGDAGGMQVMTVAVKGLGAALGVVLVPLHAFVETLMTVGRGAGAAAASLAILTDTGTTWAQKAEQLREVGRQFSDQMAAAGGRIATTNQAFVELVVGADGATASMQGATSAAGAQSAAFAQLSQQWIAIGQAMGDAAAKQQQATTNSEKLAQAAKSEGDAMVALARLHGDAAITLNAEAEAAQRNADALTKVADSRRAELEIATAQLTAKQNLIASNAEEQKAREQELKTLADKVAKLRAEAEASTQAAEAAKNEAVAKQSARAAAEDHSKVLDQLLVNLRNEELAAEAVRVAYTNGQASREQLADAERNVALAANLVKDAFDDQVRAAQAKQQALQVEAGATRTLLQAEMERARLAEQRARQMGDEYGVRQALIQQKEIEIKIISAEIEANRALAQAKLAELDATAAQLTASGQMTEAKRLEIDATRKAAEAQIALANARGESVKMMDEELRKLRSGITSADEYGRKVKEVAGTTRSATKDMAGGWAQVTAATQQATQAAQEHQRQMAQKYGRAGQSESLSTLERGWGKNTDGQAASAMESQESLNRRVAKLFGEHNIGNKDAIDAANLKLKLDQIAKWGTSNLPGQNEWQAAVRADYERLVAKLQGGGGVVGARTTGTQPGGVATFVSNITIDGATHKVNTADKESQQTLEGLLRKLAAGKGAAA